MLAPWVVLHAEACRDGRTFVLAVNRRDHAAVRLDPAEAELCRRADGTLTSTQLAPTAKLRDLLADLYAGGFLAERPPALDAPAERRTRTDRAARFLATLDVRWTGAQRLVAGLYRQGLRHAFHPAALAAQAVLALAGAAALVAALNSGRSLELRVDPWHLPALLAMSLIAIAVHELAHGLVVVHAGHSVDAAGFRLHLGSPSFYVESVEALLLPRRTRMIQAAAGPWAEWLVTSIAALVLWRSPLPFLVPVLHRFVVLNALTVASNLLPFVGLDGYLLAADIVREPELNRRSAAALRQHPSSAADVALSVYALLNGAVAVAFLTLAGFMWWAVFGKAAAAVASAGPLGLAGVAIAVAVLFRPAAAALVQALTLNLARASRLADRARFRAQRRWRVACVRSAASHPALAGLDEYGLAVVAGALTRRSGAEPIGSGHTTVLTMHRRRVLRRFQRCEHVVVADAALRAARHGPPAR